ncbi:HAD family hydrolase [Salinarimonas sp.]|uniref:HAD family hydrolase n=1 Tax=Salinarimonas sp. TaxID=2766526 RepID=UPI00391AEF30
MALDALLFDKDGTLVDFDATWGPAAYAAMRELSRGDAGALAALMEASRFVEEEMRFLPSSPLVAGSSAEYGPVWARALGREATPDFFAEMDALFRVHGLAHLTPIHDPLGVLGRLAARGLALGIATNDAEASAHAQAQALGLTPFLDFVAGYDSGFGSKPAPGMVGAFVAKTGLAPHRVGMVGDSLHDLHAARAAGVVAIAVLTGPRAEAARPEIEPHADHVVPSIAELEALLDTLSAKAAPSASPSA